MGGANFKKFIFFTVAVAATLGVSLAFQYAVAVWTAPLNNPPACNSGDPGCDAPLNISDVTQQKLGTLFVNIGNHANGLIVPNGNVGIGMTPDGYKLDVSGSERVSGGIDVSGGTGRVGLQPGSDTAAGYVQWFRPDGTTRIGYLGWSDGGVNNLGLNLENSASFNINGGNVGIGTTDPGSYRLNVAGDINATGKLCIADDCKAAWPTGGSSQWVDGATWTGIYYNLGQVVIGATNNNSLKANGSKLIVTDGLYVQATTGSGSFIYVSADSDKESGLMFNERLTTNEPDRTKWRIYRPESSHDLRFADSAKNIGYDRVTFTLSGNVGIGITSPDARLDLGQLPATTEGLKIKIGSKSPFSPIAIVDANESDVFRVNESGNVIISGDVEAFITQTNSGSSWLMGPTTGISSAGWGLYSVTGAAYRLAIDNNGNVGIGTTGPGYPLSIIDNNNSAIINIFNSNTTPEATLWTGIRLARSGTGGGAEKWFMGMNSTDNFLRIRRNDANDDITVDSTNGNVSIANGLLLVSNSLKNCGKLTTDSSGNIICGGPGGVGCGNGAIDAGEQCDDSNNINGDGCSSSCAWEIKTFICAAKPSGTSWNTVGSYIETCTASNGTACTNWYPMDSTAAYDNTPTLTACHYVCPAGQGWNGSACAQTWNIQTVSPPLGTLYQISLAVDANGKNHIAYDNFASQRYYIEYVNDVSGSWSTTHMSDCGTTLCLYPSIAVDSNGKIHLVYLYNNTIVKYATNASGSWVTANAVTCSPGSCSTPALALDANNKAYISYVYWYSGIYSLGYATNSGGDFWEAANNIALAKSVLSRTSIAIDTNGKSHIAYINPDSYLASTNNVSGVWNTTSINSVASTYPAITVDANIKEHISYYRSPSYVGYYTNATGFWVEQQINSTGNNGYPAIAIDTNNKEHISNYNGNSGQYDLMYSNNATGSWTTAAAVDQAGNVGLNSSIKIDSTGRVHISYYDSSNKLVKCAVR